MSSRVLRMAALVLLALVVATSPPALAQDDPEEANRVFLVVEGDSTEDGRFLLRPAQYVLYPPPFLVNVTFRNADFRSNVSHDFHVEIGDEGYTTPLIRPGETASIEFLVSETGRFPYWCTVPGHRDLGMEGALIVALAAEGPVVPGEGGVALRAYWIGLIGIFSMVAVIIVSYFVIKYESRHHTDEREHRRRGLP